MKNLFLISGFLSLFNGFGQTPGKDSLILSSLTVDRHTEYYMSGTTGHYSVTDHFFFKFGNGIKTNVKNDASNVYDIVKIFPSSAQKLMECKRLRKQHTILSAASVGGAVIFLAGGIIAGLNLRSDPTNAVVFGSIGLAGIISFYTLKIPIKKIDRKFQENLEEGVILYNQNLSK